MQQVRIALGAFLGLALALTAQAQGIPTEVGIRYSQQVSNGSAGVCGCFTLEGAAGDLYWQVKQAGASRQTGFGLAADVATEHTGDMNGAGYGLTLTTLAAGPRFVFVPARKFFPFAQALFGFAHGSGSRFPQGNALTPSANSFALEAGGGADYALSKHLSLRILELEYLRTSLPNNSTNWQNHLRAGVGITLHFPRK
jgi:opacity protein-like surface antigen